MIHHRRDFVKFLGWSLVLSGCRSWTHHPQKSSFQKLKPSSSDNLELIEGLTYQTLISWNEVIGPNIKFGMNNDFIAWIPLEQNDGILWVNHEYPDPYLLMRVEGHQERNKEVVIKEQENVGGSLLRVRRREDQQWEWIKNDPFNRRISGRTPIPIVADKNWPGSRMAIGTLGNCGGGLTPWKTVLTCEENSDNFYGPIENGKRDSGEFAWDKFFDYPENHYGWVVEINPLTGDAKKLTGLGRFAHESATVAVAQDGRAVVYSGDDNEEECLYKFISKDKGSLEEGTLYVADLKNKKWIPLVWDKHSILQNTFKNQSEVLIHTRQASKLVGGTPLDRPEDIEIDPTTRAVLLSLTNHKKKGNYFGSILKLEEKNSDPLSLEFEWSEFLTGGESSGFACPDNLAFDRKNHLWIATDISTSSLNKEPYQSFQNNGLFMVPSSGLYQGAVLQVASAPVGAELTGMTFTPDGSTLFLSVQHPGETSTESGNYSSTWPRKNPYPQSSVVAIDLKDFYEKLG